VAFQVQADTHYVDLAGSHTAPYTSWATAATNIQVAVNAAVDGDTVLVTNGTYVLTSEIVVTEDILLESVNGPDVTIVDGDGVTGCFNLGSSACVVSGLTITNGRAIFGGGIFCTTATPLATNCTITGNAAIGGGGNGLGGGMYHGTADHCMIIGNTATAHGGGMRYGVAYNCTISGNTATGSGGGRFSGTSVNCLIIGNTALGTLGGGGLYFGAAQNCTISDNTATSGGGMKLGTADNCIIWYNTASTSNDVDSVALNHTCSPGATHGSVGNITNAPAFMDQLEGDYRLAAGSPCIDSGTNAYWNNTTDLDGNPRILNGTVDMGAYEFVEPPETLDHFVALDGSHTAPYTNWAMASTNIQAAVDEAVGGDTVHITNGTYLLISEIVVASSITIESVNGADMTIIDGGGGGGGGGNRCFNLGDSACVVSGLTITNGNVSGDGGGVYCTSTNPLVNNCVITGNRVRSGGSGGGMYYGTANNCEITGNRAAGGSGGKGGGMRLGTANNCTISGNMATGGTSGATGGGVHSGTANNCVISGNTAYSSGGMHSGTANNCVISSNTATGGMGGGMRSGIANNCTITGNAAISSGGVRGGKANNCIIWYNTAGADNNDVFSGIQNHTCSPDVVDGVSGNITNAPSFVDQSGSNYRLAFNSFCIDAGTNGLVVGSTDLDGAPRIVGANVDMGAYEYDVATADSDGDGMTDGWEALYFGSATGALASANADVDSSNNGDEYIAGTDPTNAASFFSITNTSAIAEGFVMRWEAVTGRVYGVNWTATLTNGFEALETDIAYPRSSYTDTLHAAETKAFYYLEVKLAE